jgi:hypothetical protein
MDFEEDDDDAKMSVLDYSVGISGVELPGVDVAARASPTNN